MRYSSTQSTADAASALDELMSQVHMIVDVQGVTVLMYKATFHSIRTQLDATAPEAILSLKLPMGTGSANVKKIIHKMLCERMKHNVERIANWTLMDENKGAWNSTQIYDAVKAMSKDEFDRFILDARLKSPHERSEIEAALLKKGVLTDINRLRANALEKQKLGATLKFLDDAIWESHAKFPRDCQNLDILVTLPEGKTVTLEQFITYEWHLQYALLLLGPKQLGKSPFVRAVAYYWTLGYLGEHDDGTRVPLSELAFAYCATAAALNRISACGVMKSKMPVIVDDSDLHDPDMNRTGSTGDFQGLRANYVKHLLNVQDGGECGARFNQTTFKEEQPRIFGSNEKSADDWLPKRMKPEDKEAVMKRLAVCIVPEDKPLIQEQARAVFNQRITDQAARMRERAARLAL